MLPFSPSTLLLLVVNYIWEQGEYILGKHETNVVYYPCFSRIHNTMPKRQATLACFKGFTKKAEYRGEMIDLADFDLESCMWLLQDDLFNPERIR